MRSFKSDYEFGKMKEPIILEKIRQYFKDDSIIPTEGIYAKHDFKGKNKTFELKCRKFHINKYPTTIIAKDKILKTEETEQGRLKQYFLFSFTDRLTFIEYTEDTFKDFECKNFRRWGRVDFVDKEKLYYYIPITRLIDII